MAQKCTQHIMRENPLLLKDLLKLRKLKHDFSCKKCLYWQIRWYSK